MKKPFNLNFRRLRWKNSLLARALFFTVAIALSSSGEDVNVRPADISNHLAAPGRVDERAIAQLLEQAERELQSESERSKSSKGGSKSASKQSKSKASKSKSGKNKSGKNKSGKSKSGKSKSGKSKSGKSKSGKSKSGKGKGGKSVSTKGSKSAKSETGRIEPEEESEDESIAHSANSNGSEGSEGSVASQSTAENPDADSATSITSSNGNSPVEEREGTGSDATATSSYGWVDPSAGDEESGENKEVVEPDVDLMDESNTNDRGIGDSGENEEVVEPDVDLMEESNTHDRDIGGDADAQSNDNFAEEQNNANTETTASSGTPEQERVDENSVGVPNLNGGPVEVRIEEDQDMEDMERVELEPEMKSEE